MTDGLLVSNVYHSWICSLLVRVNLFLSVKCRNIDMWYICWSEESKKKILQHFK